MRMRPGHPLAVGTLRYLPAPEFEPMPAVVQSPREFRGSAGLSLNLQTSSIGSFQASVHMDGSNRESNMLKSIVASVAATALLTVAGASVAANISGAGATFPAPVYAKWAEAYKAQTNNALNYQAI